MDISCKIEALLFWKAEPVSIKKLAGLLKVDVSMVKSGLDKLEKDLSNRGLSLVRNGDEVMMGTAKELSSLIEEVTKEEISRDLGKAGLETLSIILYQGPISRTDIDYIRGVNSQFILRNLLIRGLVERVDNPSDARSFLYQPTLTLLSHLGVIKIEDLPEYNQIRQEIDNFKKNNLKNDVSTTS
jgi:segregation and condensation protein B